MCDAYEIHVRRQNNCKRIKVATNGNGLNGTILSRRESVALSGRWKSITKKDLFVKR